MLRSFLPIGQGAFYRETFDFDSCICNIIYDCGSSSGKEIVKQLIAQEFASGETIDAVFISHLDEDHINGLPYLLDRCKVKNLFFPLITDANKVYLQLNALLVNEKNTFLQEFIADPYRAVHAIDRGSETHLFAVVADDDEGDNNIHSDFERYFRIRSGIDVVPRLGGFGDEQWELVPYNFKQEERLAQLRDAVASIFDCDDDSVDDVIRELLNNYPDDKKKIKEAYKKVSGSFNINSMTLFSGTRDHNVKQRLLAQNRCYCYCDCMRSNESGCLYLGDYDASRTLQWDLLEEAYRKYWRYIGCVQIPHHGSKHNFNMKLAEIHAFKIISAGHKSRCHPSRSVLVDLYNRSRDVFVVTEQEDSRVDFGVNLFYGRPSI